MSGRGWIAAFLLLMVGSRATAGQPRELWVYCPTNLLVDANVDKLDKLWHRAAAAGYSKVLLTDSKFARLDDLGSNTKPYFANIERVKKLAAETHLQIVPAVFSIGYSNDLLSHDPNLAEAVPVRDTPLVVRNNVATVEADPAVSLKKMSFKDDAVRIDGDTATVSPTGGNARMVFALKLPKFRCYHLSAMVKTDGFSGDARIMPLAGDMPLSFSNAGIKPTQDWTRVDAVFDTLDHTDVNVYFGVWGGVRGSLQWKDWRIEEAGLVNVVRRAGAPLSVKGFVEGKDFDRIQDPLMGTEPWPGEYTVWHEPPVIRTHGLADGTKLSVSWYYPPTFNDGQVTVCPSEPKTMKLLADQARSMKSAWGATEYMMSHDEIRCLNWDAACQDRHLDAGPLLADNLRACTKLLGGSTTYAWSDMFDPSHNAHGGYYLVRGDLKNSWAGLDKKTVVVNWNFEHRDESLKFFADRGNRQVIAGYYDGDVGQVKQWIASADRVPGVVGIIYTTWADRYDDLEAFARACGK